MADLIFSCLLAMMILGQGVLPGVAQAETRERYTPLPACGFTIFLEDGVRLYTPDKPGPFQFAEKSLGILMNGRNPDLLLVNRSEIATETELDRYLKILQAQGLAQTGYRRLSLGYTAVGNNFGKRALEHLFELQGPVTRTLRQIYFIHRGQGFVLTAICPSERFEEANRTFFEPLLQGIIFE